MVEQAQGAIHAAAAKAYTDGQLSDYAAVVTSSLGDLQSQIDGNITTWFYAYVPTTANAPASGLCLKTYNSDLYQNWINTEWIEGVNGINEASAVNVSDGTLSMDALNLPQIFFDSNIIFLPTILANKLFDLSTTSCDASISYILASPTSLS